jgi:hypothetical protein
MADNLVSQNILNLNNYIINNKWLILFLIFGVLIAYALGKKFGLNNENFNNETVKKSKIDNDKTTEDFHSNDSKNEKDDMINRAIDRGVKNIKAEPIIKKTVAKPKCKKVDLTQYVHKSLVPDIDDYVPKDTVDRFYISNKNLDKNYMLKKNCKPKDVDYTKFISRDDLKNYYVSKTRLDKKYIKKEDCDCSESTDQSKEPEVIQKVEVRRRKKIIEVPEIVYKKVKVEVEEPIVEVKTPPVLIKKKSPKQSPLVKKTVILLKQSPKKKSKCNSPRLLKQQSILDKNRLDMSDNYSKVDDTYTYCNAKSCAINGFPNGLSTSTQ